MNITANNSEKKATQQHHLAFHTCRTQVNHMRQAVTTETKKIKSFMGEECMKFNNEIETIKHCKV